MGGFRHYISLTINFAIILAALFFNSQTAKATHAMGADLAWECIGPNQYRFTLKLYRDCNGVNLNNSQTLNISRCGSSQNLTLTRIAPPIDITPLCASEPRRCGGGSGQFGVEEWIYRGTVTFPAGCNNIRVSYTLCCRNNAITTLSDPLNENIYVNA